MSSLVAGIMVIASFLLASVIMFGTFLNMSADQAQSLKDLGKISQQKVGSAISITTANVSASSPGITEITLEVDNTGSESVADFSEMDVIVEYTNSADVLVQKYLDFDAASLKDNQWTNPVTGITPDTFNPRMWDSDETFTINLRVALDVKAGTSALVVVSTPRAASDQALVGN